MTIQTHHKALIRLAVAIAMAWPCIAAQANTSSLAKDLLPDDISLHDLSQDNRNADDLKPDQSAIAPAAQTVSQAVSQSVLQPVGDTFAPPTDDEIRQQLLIEPNRDANNVSNLLDSPRPIPSSTFLTPTAYGAQGGDAYVAVSGATVNNDRVLDGSASVGLGLGNAVNTVGAELSVGIISLDGFADDGIVGFKLHKTFPQANNLAVAVGWANPIKWGAARNEKNTFYGVVTQRFDLQPNRSNPLPLTASVGVGTGSFRSAGAIAAKDNPLNLFGSVGLRVIPKVSVISSWTGSAVGLGVSAAPFNVPLIINAGVSDLTDNTRGGTQFTGSIGYSFSF